MDNAVIGLGEGVVGELVPSDPGVVGALDVAGSAFANAGDVRVQLDREMRVGMRNGNEMGADFDLQAHLFHQLARNTVGHGFARGDFAARKFPQAGQHARLGLALGNQNLIFRVENDGGTDDFVGDFHFLFLSRKGVGRGGFCGAADSAQGTSRAVGGARRAHQCPELHPGFVGCSGVVVEQEGIRKLLQLFACGGAGDVVGECQQTREDTDDVALQHGQWQAEGKGCDRGSAVGSEAWQRGQEGGIGRQLAAVVVHQEFSRCMDMARAGVVAEAFPLFQHILQGGGGQSGDMGEAFQKALEIGDDRIHLGLLQHNLGNPHGIGIERFSAPGQVAGILSKPWQQALPNGTP